MDEDVARMSSLARIAWAYIPCHADREGRLRDSAFTLKLAILPADDVDMDDVLDELARARHIVRYEVDGRRFIQIRNFAKYQTPHVREGASGIPAQPVETVAGIAKAGPSIALAIASTPIPDPIPDPDPIPETVPDLGTPWPAGKWLTAFGSANAAKYDTVSYGNTSDAKACGVLADFLAGMAVPERIAAQGRAPAMFAEFLRDDAKDLVKARHPFVFFVARFGGLRHATGPPRVSAPTVFLTRESSR